MLLQILVIIFALFAISRSYIRLRDGGESVYEFIFWMIVWAGIVVIVLFPSLTSIPAKVFNIQRGIDVFIYLGMIILFYSVYRIYAKIEKLEQELTKLTRKMAKK
ncbi:MAG: DUF2304 domain-containing protein [Candidatus Nanoarchaeia archaeon]